ncbi:MAG: sugar phosphate isomerase/epimerase family protein [Burkholderiales bacterium]
MTQIISPAHHSPAPVTNIHFESISMNLIALAPTTLPNTPPIEYLAAASTAGYQAVGVRVNRSPGLPFHPVIGDATLMRDIKRFVSTSGITVLDLYSFYLQSDTRIEQFKPALEFGAELGAKYAMVMGDDPDWARMRDNLALFCELAMPLGLTAVLEFAITRPLATLQQTTRLIAESGRINAAVCLDPLNMLRGTGGPELLAGLDPRLFPYAQITDGVLGPGEPDLECARRNGPNVRRLPGEGDVPLGKFLDALPAGIPLSLEAPPPDRTDRTAAEWARLTLDTSRDYLAAYYEAKR